MKKSCLTLALVLCAGAYAQSDTVIRWRGVEGLITAPGVDNIIGQIHSGTGPWTVRSGSARINMTTGEGSFEVEGLVLNGGVSTGTPGAVTGVVGTLVCNAGSPQGTTETALDSQVAALNSTGDAELSFKLNIPAVCNNPLFLIRVPAGRWIATGVKTSVEPLKFRY